jgi:N6-L-threonylcarbamoyladenine synthase/tRNA threonylcarbamoyladenosine biosynthesis protein TsaB
MRLLAFDTSTAQGSVAVLEGERVLSERSWRRAQSHSEYLTSEIEEALKDAQLTPAELDALAVGQGPGSFTGIRVAINAARALGYALQKPIYVRDTSAILVQPIMREEPVLVLINAQKNSFFASRFVPGDHAPDGWRRARPLEFKTLDEVQAILLGGPHLCVGDGCELAELDLRPEAKLHFMRDASISDFPLATSLGHLTFSQRDHHPPLDWNAVQPLYIRASGAEEKLTRVQKN